MRERFVAAVMAALGGVGAARAQESVQLAPIVVNGTAQNPDGSSVKSGGLVVPTPSFGPLGNIKERDVPFATTSIPRAILDDQIVHYGANALMNDPSVQATATTGGSTQSYRIRGFYNQNNLRVDGLPLKLTDDPGFYNTERVDVLKGATSVLYGFAAPSGIVNYISKKPLDGNLTQLDLYYGTLSFGTGHIDVNRRWGAGDVFGVRLNVVEEGGGTSIRPQTLHHNTEGVAFDYRPDPTFKAWTSYEHDNQTTRGIQGQFFLSPSAFALPPVPNGNKLILPTYTFQNEDTNTVLAGVEWTPPDWHFDATVGYVAHTFFYDFAQVGQGTLNADGTFDYIPFNQKNLTNVGAYRVNATRTIHLGSAVSNDVSLSNTGSHSSQPLLAFNQAQSLGVDNVIAPINFANPNVTRNFTNLQAQDNYLESVDLIDRLYLGDKIALWGGAIYSYVNSQTLAYGPPVGFTKTSQGEVTPVAAVLFKPIPTVTAYFSFIEALQQGQQAPLTAANANQTLAPFVGEQYEVGVKSEVRPGLEVDVGLFSVSAANAYLDPTDNVFKAAGKQVDRGIEFTVRGQVTENLRAFGGFMFMDAKVRTDPSSFLNNTTPQNIANVRGNIFLEYLLPGTHLSLLGGGYYTGDSFANSGVALVRVPQFATFDFGGKYETVINNVPTTARLYVTNALNARYWQTYTNIHPGDPRTARLSLTMRF